MDTVQKFYADIRRIVKHGRSNGEYCGEQVCKEIAAYFSTLFTYAGSLPESIGDYWLQKRILKSENPETEPSEANIRWLISAADILNGTYSDDGDCEFSRADWKELCSLVNYEAEDLPIDTLTQLMSLFMSKNVL